MNDDDEQCRGRFLFPSSYLHFLYLDINECLSNPCPKTMTCENTLGSFRCIEGCDPGYIWSIKHGQCRDIDECAILKHDCTHGQRCENMPGTFR